MEYKTLALRDNLQEQIQYNHSYLPLSICEDHFDEYLSQEWACHWHDDFEIAVLLSGSLEFTIYRGRTARVVVLSPGDGIFINSGYLHKAKAKEPQTVLQGFALSPTFFEVPLFENTKKHVITPLLSSSISHMTFQGNQKDPSSLFSLIHTLCTKNDASYDELSVISLLCLIWKEIASLLRQEKIDPSSYEKATQEQRVKEILSYLHSHYSETIQIDDIAKTIAISRTECFRSFKQVLGKSPMEYLTSYRLSMAAAKLISTKEKLSHIALSCGFHTPSYFGKQFKAQYGLTPQKYREKFHEEHSHS